MWSAGLSAFVVATCFSALPAGCGAAAVSCPQGYYQNGKVIWPCSGSKESVHFFLDPAYSSPVIHIPEGTGNLNFVGKSSEQVPMMLIDMVDRTIINGESGGIISIANPTAKYKGMDIECTSATLAGPLDKKCTIAPRTTAPLLVRFDSPYGLDRSSVVTATIAYSSIEPCPDVMYGCLAWNMSTSALAAEKVHSWATWADKKFGGAEEAWNKLADMYAFKPDVAGGDTPDREVPLFAWPPVWKKYESDNSHGWLAFHFFDTDHDLRVSREEFTFAYAISLRSPSSDLAQDEEVVTAPGTTGAASTTLQTAATAAASTLGGSTSGAASTTQAASSSTAPATSSRESAEATTSSTEAASSSPQAATGSVQAATSSTASSATGTSVQEPQSVEVVGDVKLRVQDTAPYTQPGPTQMILGKDWADALAERSGLNAALAVHFSAASDTDLNVMYRITSIAGKSPEELSAAMRAIQPEQLMQSVGKALDGSFLSEDVRAQALAAEVIKIEPPHIVAAASTSTVAPSGGTTGAVRGEDPGILGALGGIEFTQWLPWAVAGAGLALWCLCSLCLCCMFRSGSKNSTDYRELVRGADLEHAAPTNEVREVKLESGEAGSSGDNGREEAVQERGDDREHGPHSQTFDKLMSNDRVRIAIEEHPSSWRFHHNRVLGYRDRLEDGFRALFDNELLLVDSRKDRDGRSRDPLLRGYMSFVQTCLPQGGGYGGMARVAAAAKSVATIFGGGLHELHDIDQLEANWKHRFRECGLVFPADLPIGTFMGRRGTPATAYVPATPGRRGAGLPRHRAVLFKYVCDALTVCDSAIVWDARRSTVIAVAIAEGAPVVVDLLDEPGSMTDGSDLDDLIRHASERALS